MNETMPGPVNSRKLALPILLVVDDEPEVLRSIYDLLRTKYQVVTFERATDALAVLESLNPQIVMSDQRMPGMTGVEFLHEVRLRAPDATRLLFTAYSQLETVIAAVNEGNIYRYISKPWDPQELASVVGQALEHNKLRVERRTLIAELQEANAKLAESNKLKEQFIEVASHELKTPVTVILGLAELWSMSLKKTASQEETQWLEAIRLAGRRLAVTVERMVLLLYSNRLQETLHPQSTLISSVIEQVVTALQPFIEARNLNLKLELEPNVGEVSLDATKIGDVLTNLIMNSIKFTKDGGTITVSAGSVGPDQVYFEVTDTGIGISAKELPFLFQPFFTGYDARHHSSGIYEFDKRGIGLGLNLVKRFVEMHGGTVTVRSEPEYGSTFRVILPRNTALSQAGKGAPGPLTMNAITPPHLKGATGETGLGPSFKLDQQVSAAEPGAEPARDSSR